MAHHFRQARDPRAAEWLIAAGARAQRAYAWLTAAARYEAALALLEARGVDGRERAVLLLTLAQVQRYGGVERTLTTLERARRLASAAGDEALAAAILFDQGHTRCFAGDVHRGLAEMAASLPALDALPLAARSALPTLRVQEVAPGEDYHRGALIRWLANAGRYAEARAHGEAMRRRAPGTTARGLAGLAQMYAALGQPEEAARAYGDAEGAYRAAGQYLEVGSTLLHHLEWLLLPYHTDRAAERERVAGGGEAAWARGQSATVALAPRFARLPLLLVEGHWAEAGQLARAARADAQMPVGYRYLALVVLGALARAQGDRAGAWQCVREGAPAGPAAVPGHALYLESLILQRLAAHLAIDAGDLPTAGTWLAAHDRWLTWAGAVRGRAEGDLGWATYDRAVGDLAAARTHATAALAHATEPRQPLALLAAHRLLGELATAAGRQDEAAAHLAAALALAEACAAPYERALTLLALAELHAATGERATVTATLAEARALLVPLAAAPALTRAEALEARLLAPPAPAALPFGLTAREAEVLRLVAAGLSDAEVAERLFLSRFTIRAHMRAVYGKLGTSSRTTATRLALEHGLA